MSHEIEKHDQMAYVGQVPWHGLGINLGDQLVDSATMIQAANLGWTVSCRPLYFPEEKNELATEAFGLVRMPERRAVVRDDLNLALGEVGGRYTVVQNTECAGFLDGLLSEGDGVRYETAGSLRNGARVWFLARMGEGLNIRRRDGSDDLLETYLLVVNFHDGSGSLKVLGTSVRVVCANTLGAAMSHHSNVYALRHVPTITERIEECRNAIALEREYFVRLGEVGNQLEQIPMTKDELRDVSASAISDQEGTFEEIMDKLGKRKSESVESDVKMIEMCFDHGAGSAGETRWDGLNAITDFLDHHRNRAKKGRDFVQQQLAHLDDTFFGEGARVKQRAVRLLTRW